MARRAEFDWFGPAGAGPDVVPLTNGCPRGLTLGATPPGAAAIVAYLVLPTVRHIDCPSPEPDADELAVGG